MATLTTVRPIDISDEDLSWELVEEWELMFPIEPISDEEMDRMAADYLALQWAEKTELPDIPF